MFERQSKKDDRDPNYRLTQTGVGSLVPFMSKRTFEITKEEFLFLAFIGNSKKEEILASKYENIIKIQKLVEFGFFAISCEVSSGIHEHLCAHIMKSSIVILASNDHIEGLRLKYEPQLYQKELWEEIAKKFLNE